MDKLPLSFKTYFPKGVGGANITLSYWYEPHEEDLLEEKGCIGLFVSLSGPGDLDGERAAKFIWDSFREEYYEFQGTAVLALKAAVKAAKKRLVVLIENDEIVSEQGVDLHLCGFGVIDGKAHFSIIGSPEVWLVRNEEAHSINDMLPAYDGIGYSSDVSVGSFELKENDTFILSSPQLVDSFFKVFDDESMREVLSDWSRLTSEVELFADNMAGNQYMWLIGVSVKEGADAIEKGEKLDNINESAVLEGGVRKEKSMEPGILGGVSGTLSGVASKLKLSELWTKLKSKLSGLSFQKVKEWTAENLNMSVIKRKLGSTVSSFKVGGGRDRKIFITKAGVKGIGSGMSKKNMIIIGGVILAVMLGIIGYSVYRKNVYETAINSEIILLEEDLSQAQAAWETNKNDDEANASIDGIRASISELQEMSLSDEQKDRLSSVEIGAQSLSDRVHRVTVVSEQNGNFEIVLDTYLKVGESSEIVDIAKYGQEIYLVDKAQHTLYRYKLDGGAVEEVANSKEILKEPEIVVVTEEYIFVYDKKLGVVSLDKESVSGREFAQMPELSIRSIGNVVEMSSFGGNLYILTSDGNKLMKSLPAGEGFSYPMEYFQLSSDSDLVDLLIDGNIYILTNDEQKLYKFFTGRPDSFSLSGFDKPLGEVCCGFTNLYGDKPLYVFDKDNRRVVAIEKGTPEKHPGVGIMLTQFVYRGNRGDIFKNVKEITADTDGKYLYVLDGSRVLKISLDYD
ncbi:hypothetical protein JW710_03855 [Candidatus Dojkabacteria bacterium]|nr:hypothetical protein [Candidatus Dojkabacteria bacterium]